MTRQTALLPDEMTDGRAFENDDARRGREEDLTPTGVALACMPALLQRLDPQRTRCVRVDGLATQWAAGLSSSFRVIDVCCGYGVWAQQFARWWVHGLWLPREWLHITGVEVDGSKREHAAKWCDRFVQAPARGWLTGDESADLVLGNPAFSMLAPQRAKGETLDEAAARSLVALALDVAPAVALFHQAASFQRGRVGAHIWEAYPPAAVWRVPGSIDFRGGDINPATGRPYGSDLRSYQLTLWLRGHEGPTVCRQLSWLASSARKWRGEAPGTEDPSDELPSAPGWSP